MEMEELKYSSKCLDTLIFDDVRCEKVLKSVLMEPHFAECAAAFKTF